MIAKGGHPGGLNKLIVPDETVPSGRKGIYVREEIEEALLNHGRSEVNPDDFSMFTGDGSGYKAVISGTAPQIYYYITFFDVCMFGGQSASQPKSGIGYIAF